jgi:hypothetical protein
MLAPPPLINQVVALQFDSRDSHQEETRQHNSNTKQVDVPSHKDRHAYSEPKYSAYIVGDYGTI